MSCRGCLGFGRPMDGSTKNTEDDSGIIAFVIEGTALSTICESNKSIWDILGMKVALETY